VEEQSVSIGRLSEQITTPDCRLAAFEERVDRWFEAIDRRLSSARMRQQPLQQLDLARVVEVVCRHAGNQVEVAHGAAARLSL
jgi:hypothetical protein